MRPQGKTQPQHLLVHERRMAALRLRQMGMTYRQISAVMRADPGWRNRLPAHYRERHVHFDVVQAFEHQRNELAETVTLVRQQEIDRLDRMLLGVWSRAQNGDDRAIQSALAIMARRARLLPGLEAPVPVAPSAPGRAAHDEPLPIEEAQALVWHLAQYGLSQQHHGNGRGDASE